MNMQSTTSLAMHALKGASRGDLLLKAMRIPFGKITLVRTEDLAVLVRDEGRIAILWRHALCAVEVMAPSRAVSLVIDPPATSKQSECKSMRPVARDALFDRSFLLEQRSSRNLCRSWAGYQAWLEQQAKGLLVVIIYEDSPVIGVDMVDPGAGQLGQLPKVAADWLGRTAARGGFAVMVGRCQYELLGFMNAHWTCKSCKNFAQIEEPQSCNLRYNSPSTVIGSDKMHFSGDTLRSVQCQGEIAAAHWKRNP